MNLTLRYIRCVHLLVFVGIVAYSIAEENLIFALIAAPVTMAAYLIVGGPGGRPIPRWGINLAFLIATVMMIRHWSNSLRGDTITVLCTYLVWLQLIKLFEPRAPRDQAQILMLSLMLAVGACLTSVTIELGAVLVVYVPLLLVTVMLYQVYAAHARASAPAAAPPAGRAVPARRPWRRVFEWLFGVGGDASHGPLSTVAYAGRSARPDLARAAFAAGLIITLVAPFVYVTMPRGIGESMFGRMQPAASSYSVTGFRNHVQLGSEGLLTESQRAVMSVRVETQGDPYVGRGRPLHLRGAVLDLYDPSVGTWKRSHHLEATDRRVQVGDTDFPRPTNATGPFHILHVSTESRPASEIFTVWKPLWVAWIPRTRRPVYFINFFDGYVSAPNRGSALEYTVVCAPADATPEEPVPFVGRSADPPFMPEWVHGLTARGEPLPPRPTRQFSEGRIRDLAEEILREARIDRAAQDRDGNRPIVAAFARHLQRTCRYTTRMTAPLPGEDPIEMFLFDPVRGHKGHCEYFASALAALCLSVDVPARLVTGYLASEFDLARGAYTVRENHAHAWIEAEIRPGRWEVFDPSPSQEIDRLHHPQGLIAGTFRRVMDAVQMAWIEGIVAYNRERQASTLQSFTVAPLDALRALNERLSQWLSTEEQIAQQDRAVFLTRITGWSVLAASAAILGLHFVVSRVRALAALAAGRGRTASRSDVDRRLARMGELVEQVMALLARAGYRRAAHVPALAHVRAVTQAEPGLASSAISIVHRFYLARFAGERLTEQDLADARRRLRELTASARRIRDRRGARPQG